MFFIQIKFAFIIFSDEFLTLYFTNFLNISKIREKLPFFFVSAL